MVGGYHERYLDVDLGSGAEKIISVPADEAIRFLGGKGVAAKLMFELLPSGADPLSPENVVVFNTGPLTGTGAPGSSRSNVTTKSPLTGLIASANCGGHFCLQLKKAGYDGLVLRGRSERPIWLDIDEDGAVLRDASSLWGKGALEAQKVAGGGEGRMAIGPAGENLVKFASVMSGERAYARCGVGAVLGSKNLKGASASGKQEISIADPQAFKTRVKEWAGALRDHPITGAMLSEFGTAVLVNRCDAFSMLPTHNFSCGSFPEADSISGEELAEKYLVGRTGCYGCPVRCGRMVMHPSDPDSKIKGPEYETLGLMGSNLGISSLPSIFEWNNLCDELGMDTISAGVVLGTAMELAEKGVFDAGIAFGDPRGVSMVLHQIAYREGAGDLMAEGARRLAAECGFPDVAPHAKGLELPAYNPRFAFGHGLGYAVANRGGCHLNGGYLVFVEGAGAALLDPMDTAGKASLAVLMQDLIEAVSASGGCAFHAFMVLPMKLVETLLSTSVPPIVTKAISKAARVSRVMDYIPRRFFAFNLPADMLPFPGAIEAATGYHMTLGRFLEAGSRTFNLERAFNLREGMSPSEDTLSGRLTRNYEPGVDGRGVPLEKMVPAYYRARGWSKEGFLRKSPFET